MRRSVTAHNYGRGNNVLPFSNAIEGRIHQNDWNNTRRDNRQCRKGSLFEKFVLGKLINERSQCLEIERSEEQTHWQLLHDVDEHQKRSRNAGQPYRRQHDPCDAFCKDATECAARLHHTRRNTPEPGHDSLPDAATESSATSFTTRCSETSDAALSATAEDRKNTTVPKHANRAVCTIPSDNQDFGFPIRCLP